MNNIKLISDEDVHLTIEFLLNEILKKEKDNMMMKRKILSAIFLEQYIDKQILLYGYFIDDKLVGVICLKDNYISHLYVAKQYRKKGIEKQLLNTVIAISDSDYLILDSYKKTVKIYKKWGFVKNKNKTNLKLKIKEK